MLLKHSASYLLARGLPGVLNFLALVIYSRLLSPESYGQYALVIASVGLANTLLVQWLRVGLVRFLPVYQHRRSEFLSTILAGLVGVAALSGIIWSITAFIIFDDQTIYKLGMLGMLLFWVEACFQMTLELARSELSPKQYGIVSFTKAAIALGLGSTLAYLGFGAFGLVISLIVGMVIAVVWRRPDDWRLLRLFLADREVVRQLLVYGLPLTLTMALGVVVGSADRFLLNWFLGTESTGLYSVSYDLAQNTVGMLMMVVNLAAYPLAVRALENNGREAASRQLSENASLLIGVALPAAGGLMLLAPNVAEVVLGSEFRSSAVELIPIVIVGALLGGIKAFYFDLSFQLGRYTQGLIWVGLVAAASNIVLNYLLIPQYGVVGSAYATVLTYLIALLLSAWYGRRIFSLPLPGPDSLKACVAVLGMVLCLIPIVEHSGPVALAGQIGVGAAAYILILFLMDGFGLRSYCTRAKGNVD